MRASAGTPPAAPRALRAGGARRASGTSTRRPSATDARGRRRAACLAQSIARSNSPISASASAVSCSHAATLRSRACVRMMPSTSRSSTASRWAFQSSVNQSWLCGNVHRVCSVGRGAEAGFDLGELAPVGGDAPLAECGGVGDGVDGEVVAIVVELELHHPVDELRDRRLGLRRGFGVQFQQGSARVADDPAGVVGAHDHLQRRGDRLLGNREHDGGIVSHGCRLEDRHRFAASARRARWRSSIATESRTRADQR